MENWMLRRAYDVGYYKMEVAPGQQSGFPWQNMIRKNRPFCSTSICQVFAQHRGGMAHTGVYFDSWNREAAQRIIQERQRQATAGGGSGSMTVAPPINAMSDPPAQRAPWGGCRPQPMRRAQQTQLPQRRRT